MSPELPPRAFERLLEVGAPLAERTESGAADLERYELGAVIGRGGMGVVYEAWDRDLERKVALKLLAPAGGLSPEARSRFLREARAAARLAHPHIAAVYDATDEFIAMQRVRGTTLCEAGIDDPRELAALIRDAALAIHYAHGEGLVHRDLKPANLMVERGAKNHVFVTDFGLAKELSVDGTLSHSGRLLGTPAYMAPEQACGDLSRIGPRTDVYGLGATLFACLAGRPPFEERDVARLLRAVAENEPPPLRALAPRVDRDLAILVARCLVKEPERRYASALALASDLERWLSGEPIEARPPSLLYRLRRYASRRQGALAAAGVAAMLAFLLALPFLVRARERRDAAERALLLSGRVEDALRAARSSRSSGAGREQEAYATLQRAIDEVRAFLEGGEVAHGRFLLGRLEREQGRHEEALASFDRAQALGADLPQLARERGLSLAALYRGGVPVVGEHPPEILETWRARSAQDLERSLAQDPPGPPTLERLFAEGQLFWARGDLERAILRLREVIEMDPGHQEAHLSLSKLFLITGRDDLGMRHSVIAADLLRGHGPAYAARAVAPIARGQVRPEEERLALEGMRELLVDFALLLQKEADSINAYGLRGQVQLRAASRALGEGRGEEARLGAAQAIRQLSSALVLREGDVPCLVARGAARALLARLSADAGDAELAAQSATAARADYDEALAARPDLAAAWYDRALLRSWTGARSRFGFPGGLERSAALEDARSAVARGGDSHPWIGRFRELEAELSQPLAAESGQ